jgi:hypothetical protein
MKLLDENVRDDQRALLRQWRIQFRQIGKELSRAGIQDPDLIPLLHHLKRPMFFTQDRDFFKRSLCHVAYCVVWLDVSNIEVAHYIRRFLCHPVFRTQTQRLGKVVRVHPAGLDYWQSETLKAVRVAWIDFRK